MSVLGVGTASAVTVAGTTTATGLIPQMSFTPGNFNVQSTTPTDGFYVVGSSGTNNLGVLTLGTSTSSTPVSGSFTLNVAFNSPGSSSGLILGSLTGLVTPFGGGVIVNFPTTPTTFNYSGGALTLTVNSVSVTSPGDAVPLTGYGMVQAVPEPFTTGLAISGLGLAVARRRSRARA